MLGSCGAMFRPSTHPVFIALLAIGLLGTPVTYRGGAAEAHPHMFLQLWHDAASGSFVHRAHQPERNAHHSHDHGMASEPETEQAQSLATIFDDPPDLTISPFVVSDWGVPVLHTPSLPSMAGEQSRAHRGFDRAVILSSLPKAPDFPPPRSSAR